MRWWFTVLWIFAVSGTLGSEDLAEAVSARVVDPHDGSRRFTWSRTSSSYSTFLVTSVNGVCQVPEPELVIGSVPESVTSRMAWLLDDTVCMPSKSSGSIEEHAEVPQQLFFRLLRTKDISLDRAPHRYPKDLARFKTTLREVPTSDSLVRGLRFCADAQCHAISVAVMMFSLANFLDTNDDAMDAATWRIEAMRWVMRSDGFIEAFREELLFQSMALYDYAESARDLGLARKALALLRRLGETGPRLSALQARVDAWQPGYTRLATEQGVSFALSENTALSGRRSAAQQFLSTGRFRLEVLSGHVESVFLDCEDPSQADWKEYRLGRQLQLAVAGETTWSTPPLWQDCALLVFGGDDARLRLWEFPVGQPPSTPSTP